jgi:hypothetical protein
MELLRLEIFYNFCMQALLINLFPNNDFVMLILLSII